MNSFLELKKMLDDKTKRYVDHYQIHTDQLRDEIGENYGLKLRSELRTLIKLYLKYRIELNENNSLSERTRGFLRRLISTHENKLFPNQI